MNLTSVSLLDRLKVAQPDATDWDRLQGIYYPLIRNWLGRVPGLGEEVADLTQDVFLVVIRELPRFDRRRDGSFRTWLRQVTVNRIRSFRRRRLPQPIASFDATGEFLERLSDPKDELAREWDRKHDQHLVEKLLAIVEPDFSPMTWLAFRRFAVEGISARQVAEDLGLTENAVILAKSRILKRLRQEAGDLLK